MSKLKKTFISLFLPLVILIVWQILILIKFLPISLIPSPVEVVISFVKLILSFKLLTHTFASLKRLIFGFVIGSSLGVLFGIVIGVYKKIEQIVSPTLQLLIPIPPIAWIPLLIIIFGIGEASKISLILIASFFTVYINTLKGIRSTDMKLIELAKIYKKSTWQVIKRILLPSSIHHIFTGLRISLFLSWVLLIAAEVIASSQGLGWLIWNARTFSRPAEMFVGMITMGILGKITDVILIKLERRITRWKTDFKGM